MWPSRRLLGTTETEGEISRVFRVSGVRAWGGEGMGDAVEAEDESRAVDGECWAAEGSSAPDAEILVQRAVEVQPTEVARNGRFSMVYERREQRRFNQQGVQAVGGLGEAVRIEEVDNDSLDGDFIPSSGRSSSNGSFDFIPPRPERPKKKRRKGVGEEPPSVAAAQGRVRRSGMVMHCRKCGGAGHNKRKCTTPGSTSAAQRSGAPAPTKPTG